jgi:hypothetical protein
MCLCKRRYDRRGARGAINQFAKGFEDAMVARMGYGLTPVRSVQGGI